MLMLRMRFKSCSDRWPSSPHSGTGYVATSGLSCSSLHMPDRKLSTAAKAWQPANTGFTPHRDIDRKRNQMQSDSCSRRLTQRSLRNKEIFRSESQSDVQQDSG
jgi:hypothetical protein